MQKVEMALRSELQEIKIEKEKKVQSLMDQITKDKEMYKQKLNEAEKKRKEADEKRQTMLFDLEKEKARFQMEYDVLLS